jgi:hypothetical protein
METKQVKVAAVQENQRQWEWQGSKFFDHYVKIEGSDQVWTYASKVDKCDKFKAGETVEAQLDIQERNGNKYYKIKPVQAATNGFTGVKKDPKDSGIITYLSCFSSACNFYAQRTCVPEDVLHLAEQGFNEAIKHSTLK